MIEEQKPDTSNLFIPRVNAWLLAVIAAVAPFLIVFNPSGKFEIDSFWGGFLLSIMILVLILFLADAIISRIKYKALWIVFLLLCPTIAQIIYLSLRTKIQRTNQ